MFDVVIGIVAVVALGGAIYASTLGDVARRSAQRALQAKRVLTATTPVGAEVVVIGKVQPGGTELDAPLSGRPCVAHRSRMYLGGVDGAHHEQAGCVPFTLERDDGSHVVIDASHAQFVFPPLPLPADAPERCAAFANALGVAPRVQRRAAYEEILVLEGMRIAVAGRLVAGWANGQPARVGGDATAPITIGVPF